MQMNVSTRQLRAFLALAEQRNFTRAAALTPPVAAGLQRADPLARGRAGRAPVRPQHAPRRADGRGARVRGRGAARAGRGRRRAVPACATMRRAARGRVSIALLPSLAAGWLPRRAGRLSRRPIPASSWRSADVLSEACIERGAQRPGRLRAGRHARRHARAARRAVLQRPLPPRLPARPSAGDARASLRPRDLAP